MEQYEKKKENHTGMSDELKSGMEKLSGYDMSDVKVHYNSFKPAQFQALAFTQGRDIHVAPGQEQYLPHEAWHVVQQKQGRVNATGTMNGLGINDSAGLEQEADVMGQKAVQLKLDKYRGSAEGQKVFLPIVQKMGHRDNGKSKSGGRKEKQESCKEKLQSKKGKGKVGVPNQSMIDTSIGKINDKLKNLIPKAELASDGTLGEYKKYKVTFKEGKTGEQFADMAAYAEVSADVCAFIGENVKNQIEQKTMQDFYVIIYGKIAEREIETGVKFSNSGLGYVTYVKYKKPEDAVAAAKKEKLQEAEYMTGYMQDEDKQITGKFPGYNKGNKFSASHNKGTGYKVLDKAAGTRLKEVVYNSSKKEDVATRGHMFDAQAKLIAEGARFQCVKRNIRTIQNDSKFWYYRSEKDGTYTFYSCDFITLWGNWGELGKEFNISDEMVRNALMMKIIKNTNKEIVRKEIHNQKIDSEENNDNIIMDGTGNYLRTYFLGTQEEYNILLRRRE